MRTFKVLAVVAVFITAVGCSSEHDQGVRSGRDAARKARGEMGEFGAGAVQVGLAIKPGKIDDTKSADWNSGFRAGYNKEMAGK